MKQAKLALLYPTLTAPENWTASCVIIGHLVAVLRGQVEFQTADHLACLQKGRTAVWKRISQQAEEALVATIAETPVQGTCRLRRATKTGAWLTVQPSTVNRRELGAQEWRDDLFLQYGLDLPDPTNYCDGCNAKFSIFCALNCKRGGLVTARHNELQEKVSDLAGKAFIPSHVRNDPLIFVDCAVKRPNAKPDRTISSTNRDNA